MIAETPERRQAFQQLTSPFVFRRDISRKEIVGMESRAVHALMHKFNIGTGIRLGIALAAFSKESVLRKINRMPKREQPPIDMRAEFEEMAQSDRTKPHFLRRDKGDYLRTLLVHKMLFDKAAMPFDRELFDVVNRGLDYVNNRGEALYWRVHLEEARSLALLYPEHREELSVDGGFFHLVVEKLKQAQECGDAEGIALIAASIRIVYPDRFPEVFLDYPETWMIMKAAHTKLSQLASRADTKTGFPYEHHLRLAEHDANMAIIAAQTIAITQREVSIVPTR